MKKILLILAISLTTVMSNGGPLVYNSIGFEYTPFIYAVASELEIEADIYILETDKPVSGMVIKNGFGGYVIFINKSMEVPVKEILAHELIHISDDIKGVWDLSVPTTIVGCSIKYTSPEAKDVERRVRKESRILYWKHRRK